MNTYLDITLLSGAGVGLNFLWEKLYKQIHVGLAEMKIFNELSAIGAAFPEYDGEKLRLGSKLRLFSPDQTLLENFNAKKRLASLSDYVHVTNIREVPKKITGYVRYKRQQSKSNIERLARRQAKHKSIEFEQALELLKHRKEVFIKAPFINMSSFSSGQHFPMFIIKEHVTEQISVGFNCYGLSAISTVPNF